MKRGVFEGKHLVFKYGQHYVIICNIYFIYVVVWKELRSYGNSKILRKWGIKELRIEFSKHMIVIQVELF